MIRAMERASPPADRQALERYARHGHRTVEGWLLPAAVALVRALAEAQARQGVGGPVVEIGVHHGRLFLLLHLLAGADERSVAYDLFEAQDENVDGSGRGDRAAFEANLRRHAGDGAARVRIRAVNSLRLSVEGIVADAGGRPRLVSVDGGHTAGITANDLRLAEGALCEGGLIVLDDVFNEAWPGVAEGTCAHLAAGSALVPVAIGGNKVVFTTGPARADAYRGALAALAPRWRLGEQVFFGRPVVCVAAPDGSPLRRAVAGTALWRAARATAAGQALRRLLLKRRR
jgi:hypothetical protein